MLSRIKDVDLGEIPARYFFFGQTYRQLVHFNGELVLHYLNKKNSKHEREMFERATAINGVSTWDTSIAKSFNKKLIIYRLDYNLRESFYTSRKWDANKIKVHSVFTNPGNAPLKGLHILIKACALLIDDYPDIEVIVPGLSSENGSVRVTSAYTRYLYKLIKRLNMAKHIRFLGKRTEKEMVADILSAHVVVIPSAIEGASLILHEAMHLGAPCISTFRGGMADFVADKEDGYLYDYPEYTYLAERICELFSDRARCCAISSNAIEKAEKAHERNKNLHEYVDMYHGVLSKGEK
jgi:glycosyltransferase involved in cell wall biosynthesis